MVSFDKHDFLSIFYCNCMCL